MKKFTYWALCLTLLFGMSACDDYLNINGDPDSPTTDKANVDIRLPWIQNYYTYAWGTAGMRANTILGLLTQTSTTSANGKLAAWDPLQSSSTTVYQNWTVGAAVNIDPMIKKAEEGGDYHYIGAGYCIKAMGYMMMLDMHGEFPMQEAFILKTDPAYDDGKSIYNLCMGYLDEAIKNFNKQQDPSTSKALKKGDLWNGGDISKWLKLCYGLKARYMLRLSKKTDLFKPDDILKALENGPQSNADNTKLKNYNVQGDQLNFTVSDPYQASALWDCTAYGNTQRLTKYYVSLLDNSFEGGSGIIDPRLSKLVPASMTNVRLSSSGAIMSYEWMRGVGVDMLKGITRKDGGPYDAIFASEKDLTVKYTIADETTRMKFITDASKLHKIVVSGNDITVTYQKGSLLCNTTNYKLAGDTIFVNMRSNSLSTKGRSVTDLFYYPADGYDYIAGTGTFYARPNSDSDILTYAEMCFIKAEIYFRKGDKDNALTAYKAGIQAHFNRMQDRLSEWKSAGSKNPDEMPMEATEIAAYMSSAAVCQSAANLTMAEIMRQKMIVMGFDMENWNDIRRFNYSAGNIGTFGNVYPGYDRPAEFSGTAKIIGTQKTDLTYWFRRYQQSSHESNYNLTQLKASNKQALENTIWSCPVWWDCSTDAEYYGFIK